MPPKRIACQMKGNYGANRYVGVYYGNKDRAIRMVPPGCECKKACGKIFLHSGLDVGGLGAGPFVGCQPLEDELLTDGYIVYEDKASLTAYGFFYGEIDQDNQINAYLGHEFSKADKLQNFYEANIFDDRDYECSIFDLASVQLHKQLSEKFEIFLEKLTPKQKEAVYAYFINNPYDQSQKRVAKKLGIKLEAFKERLNYAKKKLYKAYPELKPKAGSKKRASLWKRELIYGGFWRKSEEIKLRPVTYIDPATGQRHSKAIRKNRKISTLDQKIKRNEWLHKYREEQYQPQFSIEDWQVSGQKSAYKFAGIGDSE